MQTRAVDASFEGGLASPDGLYRNFITRVAPGDDVDHVLRKRSLPLSTLRRQPEFHVVAR